MATILEQARADEADELLKSFDWDAMERLHRKGLISDPVSKAKSVMLTDTGCAGPRRPFVDCSRRISEPAPERRPHD